MNYYHGGVPGLKIGDHILPPDETGAVSTARYGAAGICRTDRVYITNNYQAACMFAAGHPSGKGMAYRVEPEGDLEPDPDCKAQGHSYQVVRARIVGICIVPASVRRDVLAMISKF